MDWDCVDFEAINAPRVPSPVDEDGHPLPPPVKLVPGKEGQPNSWKPVPGTRKPVPGTRDRPVKWVPTHPVPSEGGGQPSSSWDPENDHWDVDSGVPGKPRIRVKPDGTIIGPDHQPVPDNSWPDLSLPPFEGLDPAVISAFVGIGIIGLIFLILWGIVIFVSGGCHALAPVDQWNDTRYAIVETMPHSPEHSVSIASNGCGVSLSIQPTEWPRDSRELT